MQTLTVAKRRGRTPEPTHGTGTLGRTTSNSIEKRRETGKVTTEETTTHKKTGADERAPTEPIEPPTPPDDRRDPGNPRSKRQNQARIEKHGETSVQMRGGATGGGATKGGATNPPGEDAEREETTEIERGGSGSSTMTGTMAREAQNP